MFIEVDDAVKLGPEYLQLGLNECKPSKNSRWLGVGIWNNAKFHVRVDSLINEIRDRVVLMHNGADLPSQSNLDVSRECRITSLSQRLIQLSANLSTYIFKCLSPVK